MTSLQEVEWSSTASATQCNFHCNFCRNGIARRVEGLQHVTFPLSNLSRTFWASNNCTKVELSSTKRNDCIEIGWKP